MDEKEFDRQVKRNLKGKELEKSGNTDEAIKLYEQNIKEGFIGAHPYNRLAIIYRKRSQFDDEISVLKKAIEIEEKTDGWRLDKYRKRLEQVEALKNKL